MKRQAREAAMGSTQRAWYAFRQKLTLLSEAPAGVDEAAILEAERLLKIPEAMAQCFPK